MGLWKLVLENNKKVKYPFIRELRVLFDLCVLKPLPEKVLPHSIVESYRFEKFPYHFQGFTYDHVELNVYLNGENLNCPLYGIKGTVYPCFYGK